MSTTVDMAIKYLDTLEYVKESKKIQDPGELAEYQVKQIEAAIETAVTYMKNDHKDFITQHDAKDFIKKDDGQNFATKSDIKYLENKFEGRFEKLEEDVQGLKGDVNALKSDVNGLKGDVQGLKEDFKELKEDFHGLKIDFRDSRYETLKYILATGTTAVSLLGGMIARGFHWF